MCVFGERGRGSNGWLSIGGHDACVGDTRLGQVNERAPPSRISAGHLVLRAEWRAGQRFGSPVPAPATVAPPTKPTSARDRCFTPPWPSGTRREARRSGSIARCRHRRGRAVPRPGRRCAAGRERRPLGQPECGAGDAGRARLPGRHRPALPSALRHRVRPHRDAGAICPATHNQHRRISGEQIEAANCLRRISREQLGATDRMRSQNLS